MNKRSSKKETTEELPLSKAAENLLSEARMVLPGIQALFGFQLIVVFSSIFAEKLRLTEQRLHLLAIVMAVVAIAIIMTPAAYHRQTGPEKVTQQFIDLLATLMLISMLPLALSLCMEFYLISQIILGDELLSLLISIGLFALFIILWLVVPRMQGLQRALGGQR